MTLKTWEDRVSRATQIVAGSAPYPNDQLAAAAASFYYKLVAADKYKPNSYFKGPVTLIRAIDNYVQMGDDYGLSEVSCVSRFQNRNFKTSIPGLQGQGEGAAA